MATGTWESPYKCNGKELDQETGLYYYGARYYDPSIAIWYGVDPLAEKYPEYGGYVYCAGNPVKFIDPDGRAAVDAVGNPAGKVIAVFYHGGATGGGNQTTVANAGHTGQIYSNSQSEQQAQGGILRELLLLRV